MHARSRPASGSHAGSAQLKSEPTQPAVRAPPRCLPAQASCTIYGSFANRHRPDCATWDVDGLQASTWTQDSSDSPSPPFCDPPCDAAVQSQWVTCELMDGGGPPALSRNAAETEVLLKLKRCWGRWAAESSELQRMAHR